LSAGVFLSGLDQTVVVTILPQVAVDLRLPFTDLDEASWIVTAYLLGYAAAMPLLGRVADVHGALPVFLVSAALFAAGSWWAALADGLWSLVAARTIQATGGGGMVPVALAVAAATPAPRSRLLALGLVAGAAEAGAVLGPLYGGAFLEVAGWRWVFWVNLPLTALLAAGALLLLPRDSPGRRVPVDWLGGLLAGLALLALTVGISSESVGLPLAGRGAAFAAAAMLAAAFVLRSVRVVSPLLPPALYRHAAFAAANAANVLVGAALVVALVQVPLFAAAVLDRSPAQGGFLLLRLTALIPVGAIAGAWLAGRVPLRAVGAAGMLVSAAGFLRLSAWDGGTDELPLTVDLAVTGIGFGLVLVPLAESALGAARGGAEAVGAASLTIARTIGMLVGLAALTAWGTAAFDRRVSGLPVPLPQRGQAEAVHRRLLDEYEAHVEAAAVFVFGRLFLAAAALCALAALAALWLHAHEGTRPQSPA
jgi:MFS family permease